MQVVGKTLWIREEVLVPRVAGPSGSILRVDIVDQMPVHVDDGRGERQAFLLEAIDKLQILGFRVPVVAAPPVAECILWRIGVAPVSL